MSGTPTSLDRAIRRAVKDLMKPQQFRPDTIPPMGADWWRSIPDEMFLDLVRSGSRLIVSTTAWAAIRQRAATLGVDLDSGSRARHYAAEFARRYRERDK